MAENQTPPTPPTPDLGQEDLEHEMEMIWRFGAGVDLGEVDLEHDVETGEVGPEHDVEIGAGTEMMELEKQVVELEREQPAEKGWGEKGHQLQHSPGLVDAQWNS